MKKRRAEANASALIFVHLKDAGAYKIIQHKIS